MSIFSISSLQFSDTFETWYNRTNSIITAVNSIQILDVQAATNAGLEETFRNGGVVIFGVNAGAGIGFDNEGALTLAVTGTTTGVRTQQTDVIFAVAPDGTVKNILGSNMVPSQVNNDINFTGNVTFSGDLSFITTGNITVQADTSFTDKQLQLAAKFDEILVFATSATPGVTSAYLIDTSIVGSDFSGFDFTSSATYLGVGTSRTYTAGTNTITVSDFIFTDTTDQWSEFTNAGATDGGRYALINSSGATMGRGLKSHDQQLAPVSRRTAPIDADKAGFAILTSDSTIPNGASEGEKAFFWRYNGSTSASAFTSTEHIQVNDGKSIITQNFESTNNQFSFVGSGSSIFQTFKQSIGGTQGFGWLYYFGGATSDTAYLGFVTAGTIIIPSLTFNQDSTITAGTTGLAENLNADLLDGANGATLGGTPNTIPITNSDGFIDPSFFESGSLVQETVTQTSHGLIAGQVVRKDNSGNYIGAIASNEVYAESVGIVKEVIDANTVRVVFFGVIDTPEIYGFSLGLGYNGGAGTTVALDPGEVYYLSDGITGAIQNTKPVGSSIVKPVFVALEDQKILVVNYLGVGASTGDTVDISSVVPVGTIYYTGAASITSNSDYIVCNGRVYSNTQYFDLHAEIQGQYYLEAGGTGGQSSIVVFGANSETRNFAVGQTLKIYYNNDASNLDIKVSAVTGVANGVRLNFTNDAGGSISLTGSGYFDDVKVYGRSAYFIVPDLRSRGVVGIDDPDGTGPEFGLSQGEIVSSSGSNDNIFDSGDIVVVNGSNTNKWRIPNLDTGTYYVTVTYNAENSPAQCFIKNDAGTTLASQTTIGGFDGSDRATFSFVVYVDDGALKIETSSASASPLRRVSGYRLSAVEEVIKVGATF